MGRILVADDHDSLRRGHRARVVGRASRGRRGAERQRRHREAPRRAIRRRPQRPEDGRQRRHGRAADGQVAATEHRRHPDDRLRFDPHGRRSDEDRRLRLRAEAVRNRRDGAEDREGDRAPAAPPRDRIPAAHAAGHLRLRPHRRRERRAAVSALHREEGGEEQYDGAHPRRNGHGQGADRRSDSPQLAARRRATSSR